MQAETSSSEPRCASAPAAASDLALASERARPRTWCPASINSRTIAEPMNPVAPVTKTRMLIQRLRCPILLAGDAHDIHGTRRDHTPVGPALGRRDRARLEDPERRSVARPEEPRDLHNASRAGQEDR